MTKVNNWVKVWFVRKPGRVAKLRRIVQGASWDHVALESDTFVCDVDPNAGVMFRRADQLKATYPDSTYILVRVTDLTALKKFLKNQMTKPLASKPQRLSDSVPSGTWHPASLVVHALVKGGSTVEWPSHRALTPQDLWDRLPLLTMSSTSS